MVGLTDWPYLQVTENVSVASTGHIELDHQYYIFILLHNVVQVQLSINYVDIIMAASLIEGCG